MLKSTPKSIHIYLESNPNPNSLKFVVNEILVPEGMSFDFPTPSAAEEAPLAQELFMYPFVDRVFYMSNFITVTKKEDVEWIEIQETIKNHIRTFLEAGKLMLVEKELDIDAIEKTNAYNGKYFVLGGILPVLAEKPSDYIRIRELARLTHDKVENGVLEEIIFALPVTDQGDSTTEYTKKTLSQIVGIEKVTFTMCYKFSFNLYFLTNSFLRPNQWSSWLLAV